jgi:hypothetical protein
MKRRTHSARSLWRVIRLTAICSFVGLAVLTIGIAIAESGQLHFGRHAHTAGTCNPTLVTTGNQAQPARWFSINSGSAADIVSAVKCTDMYQSASQGDDLIARALQTGTLAPPVLVKPYRSDVGLSQYWVVPVVDANNRPLALLTFFYNPQSRLIHEGEFDAVTGNMFYVNHAFPAVTASMSVASVSSEQHVSAVVGQAPELIYFPGDLAGLQSGRNHWQAGGTAVIDPIWRVPGADGKWHYVDHDGHAHMNTDIPVDPAYQAMPPTTATQ